MAEVIIVITILFFIGCIIYGVNSGLETKELATKLKDEFRKENDLDESKYNVTQDGKQILAMNNKERMIIIWENFSFDSNTVKKYLINFEDIYAVEKYVDGEAITRTSRSNQAVSAVIGGALFGGVGALAGALTSQKKQGKVKHLSLKIIKNDLSMPSHEINFLKLEVGFDRDGAFIKPFEEILDIWKNRLSVIIKNCDKESVAAPKAQTDQPDIVNLIKELYQLKEKGILTDEEFNNQKNKLLNN